MNMLTCLKILMSDSFYKSPNSLQFETLRNMIELPLIAPHLATQAKGKRTQIGSKCQGKRNIVYGPTGGTLKAKFKKSMDFKKKQQQQKHKQHIYI